MSTHASQRAQKHRQAPWGAGMHPFQIRAADTRRAAFLRHHTAGDQGEASSFGTAVRY